MLLISNAIHAETIWCKAFKAGCITEEQKLKHAQYCEQKGNESYLECLNKAQADPTVWQFSGKRSAQDYAQMCKSGMVATCFKMSNPHSF
jgi:hypothetical protein